MMHKRTRDNRTEEFIPQKKFKGNYDEETSAQTPIIKGQGELSKFISNPKMIELLQRKGITSLFPIQYTTFNAIFSGQDIKAKDKTGSGKTLAFSLPIIEQFRKSSIFKKSKFPKFLVMLPTRQLVLQVVSNIQSLKLNEDQFQVVGVYGGQQASIQINKINRGVDIMIATPGRLIDLINRGNVNFESLKATCLDQADEMLRQGFKEDIAKIFDSILEKTQKKTQNLLFSATFPSWVDEISRKYQTKDCNLIDLVKQSDTTPSTIKHYVCRIASFHEMPNIVKDLLDKFTSSNGKSIIFCETKRAVSELYETLGKKNCGVLHGDIKQDQREIVYRDFKSGKITMIIATNVAARGLDFPEIELVIQTQPPRQVQSYIHRSGRTGRAGKKGICVVLCTKKHQQTLNRIVQSSKISFIQLSPKDLSKSSNNH